MKKIKILAASLVLAALVFGCPVDSGEYVLRTMELTAGGSASTVDVAADIATAAVTFTGASGLTLTAGDFIITEGGTIESVTVEGDTVTVTVSFAENTDTEAEKTYTVGISPDSAIIKGSATATITQGRAGDTRKVLVAGPAVNAAANDTNAAVTFTGGTGLAVVSDGTDPTVELTDFTVSEGGRLSSVAVSGDTVTVIISFPANTAFTEKTYAVGISPESTVIRGSGMVTVTQAATAILNAYYVSWSTGSDENSGAEAAPWKTIGKVNSQTFQPGDAILFKSGDTWSWNEGDPALEPLGSGTSANPILISSYGNGAKPHFEGRGLVAELIHLHNQQHWEISNLEISNTVAGWNNPMTRNDGQGALIANKDLRGIFISGNNGQTLSGFNLHDLYIHDVTGELCWMGGPIYWGSPNPTIIYPGSKHQTGWDGSKRTGGIFLEGQAGDAPTILDSVTVENNVLERNSFGGFNIKQYYGQGADVKRWALAGVTTYPYNDPNFKPHTNIVIRGNYVDQTGFYHGDGIYFTSVRGGLAEYNVVKNPGVCGIEMYWCDNITIQYNEVYGSTSKGGGVDTNAIDPDGRTSNIIVQYNYVHDNGDGILLCGQEYNTVIIRYNVLYNNDKMWIRDGVTGNGIIQVYNNVLYNTRAQSSAGTIRWTTSTTNNEIWEYKNNVFYNAHPGTTVSSFGGGNNVSYSNNLYYGIPGVSSDTEGLAMDPGFTGPLSFGTGTSVANQVRDFSFLKPAAGSPLINQGAAYVASDKIDVSPNGLDYDGVPVGTPDIGLYATHFNGLSGIVIDTAFGEPFGGAVVKLNETTQTTTSADGKYAFPTVSPGVYTITVSKDSYMDATTTFTVNADAVSWLPLVAGEYAGSAVKDVTGTVTSGGTPLAGATVAISKGGTEITTTTAVNGTYTLVDVPAGRYTVTASKEGYQTYTILDFMVPPDRQPAAANFNLVSATNVYYNEDFDTLDDWTQTAGNIEIVTDPDDTTNKLLHISKPNGGGTTAAVGIYNKTHAGAYGVFTIETRMKRGSVPGSSGGQYHLYTYDGANTFTPGNGTNSAANIAMERDFRTFFTLNSTNTTTLQTYSANTWYRITLRLDTDTDQFAFYIDDELKGSGYFRTAVDKIDIFNICSGSTGSTFGDFWIDYIKVYQGEPVFLNN